MQRSVFVSQNSENRYPEHLYLELEVSNITSQKVDLLSTINFNEDWIPIFGGRVKFGLKGGELKLSLKNCRSPYKHRQSRRILEEVTVEIVDQTGDEHVGNIGVQRLPEISANYSVKQTSGTSYKFQRTFHLVTTKGSEEHPVWVFETTPGESILKGLLENLKIATLQVTKTPCQVVATFEASKQDLYLTNAEGFWLPNNIGRNKLAVLERIIVLNFLENRLQDRKDRKKPYLSRVELYYSKSGLSDIHSETQQPSFPVQQSPSLEMQHSIDCVVAAEATSFTELAKLANLNPRQDFAGANLHRVDFSRVNLGSPNLIVTIFGIALGCGVVFLTQNSWLGFLQMVAFIFSIAYAYRTNLSEANLSYANLHKAQLNVADLSKANLGHANLNGANLNFANLKNANLYSANLERTSLMRAGVKNAVFGKNPGLSREMRLDLKRRGAIFVDEDVDGRLVPVPILQ